MKEIIYRCNKCKQVIPAEDTMYEVNVTKRIVIPKRNKFPDPFEHLHVCFCQKCLSDILCPPPKGRKGKEATHTYVDEAPEKVAKAFEPEEKKDSEVVEYSFPELPSVEEDELEEPEEEPIPEPEKQDPEEAEPLVTETKLTILEEMRVKYPDIELPLRAFKCMDPGAGVSREDQNEFIGQLYKAGMKVADIAKYINTTYGTTNYRLTSAGYK